MKLFNIFKKSQKRSVDFEAPLFEIKQGVNADELSAVIAAITNISETIASLPLNLYKRSEDGSHLALNHPLTPLIKHAPNKTMTPYTLIEALIAQMLIYGNGYIYPIKKRNGEIISLELIENQNISLVVKSGEYFYQALVNNKSYLLPYNDILNAPYHTKDGINGIAPLRKSKATAELATAIEEHGLNFFKNGSFASGVLRIPGELSDEAYGRLSKSFKAKFSQKNAYNVPILEGGASFEPVVSENKNSQFLESKQFQIVEIARLFNIPPHKLGDLSRATFSNIEQQETNYMVQTITPLTTKLEQAFNRFLLNKNEWGHYYFKFNINAILRADSTSRWESYTRALNSGVMSINEVRELEEMNPIENGDKHFTALNLGELNSKNEGEA